MSQSGSCLANSTLSAIKLGKTENPSPSTTAGLGGMRVHAHTHSSVIVQGHSVLTDSAQVFIMESPLPWEPFFSGKWGLLVTPALGWLGHSV